MTGRLLGRFRWHDAPMSEPCRCSDQQPALGDRLRALNEQNEKFWRREDRKAATVRTAQDTAVKPPILTLAALGRYLSTFWRSK